MKTFCGWGAVCDRSRPARVRQEHRLGLVHSQGHYRSLPVLVVVLGLGGGTDHAAAQASWRGLVVQTEDRTQTLTSGRARARMLGGNLTLLTAILGSAYVPDFRGSILFLEDVNEQVYRVDRMLTELKLAGILD